MTPHTFLDAKMQLAARHGFRETSGYRSRAATLLVRQGQPDLPFEPHQYWVGTDVILDQGENQAEFTESAKRLGLHVIDEKTHLHLQPLDWLAG